MLWFRKKEKCNHEWKDVLNVKYDYGTKYLIYCPKCRIKQYVWDGEYKSVINIMRIQDAYDKRIQQNIEECHLEHRVY